MFSRLTFCFSFLAKRNKITNSIKGWGEASRAKKKKKKTLLKK